MIQPMTAIELSAAIAVRFDGDDRIRNTIMQKTTTGSEQLRVVMHDGSAFNITITRARK